jgi:glycosyltransferase involved in cell wall biosynthesis
MAGAHFVVIPLQENTRVPHGHCDISTALSLGKIVVTTRRATADTYIVEGKNGILVEPGSVEDYRAAICTMLEDAEKFNAMSQYARTHTHEYSYETYSQKLYELCITAHSETTSQNNALSFT